MLVSLIADMKIHCSIWICRIFRAIYISYARLLFVSKYIKKISSLIISTGKRQQPAFIFLKLPMKGFRIQKPGSAMGSFFPLPWGRRDEENDRSLKIYSNPLYVTSCSSISLILPLKKSGLLKIQSDVYLKTAYQCSNSYIPGFVVKFCQNEEGATHAENNDQ